MFISATAALNHAADTHAHPRRSAPWRSPLTFQGSIKLRSSFVTVLVLVVCAGPARVAADDRFDPTSDLTVNSRTIYLSGKLDPTPDHPYSGFWKHACSEDFGLAIAPAGPNLYSVSFCGKAGCFRPGTYVPNTPLVGDPNYKVEAPTRLAVKGMGQQFDVYLRCWPER